ncbi:hypothetical protein GDO86_012857 [Hymenochirus boettgeri]|uniref:NXPE C-terminal domain-containing protein n=1 Tax=Hymenochirus boettgeri TaxID=247094 RepID=A0A8T2IUD1_9PIPI|nr:hypothetical protein GDO86_012857 [Hymenochirus boettgeri]
MEGRTGTFWPGGQKQPSGPFKTELQKQVNQIFSEIDKKIPKITFTHIDNTTKAHNSKAFIIDRKDKYCVGDSLIVQVDMFDNLGKQKTFGGDLITARIFSPEIKAGASGKVEDLKNGSYHVHFAFFWEGTVQISILLIHPSEGVSALWQARNKGYGYVAYTGRFVNQTIEAKVTCGFEPNRKLELCEYSDVKEEEYFYCERPMNMPCGSLVQMRSAFVDSHSYLNEMEKRLFNRSNIRVEIPKMFDYISVSHCNKSMNNEKKKCSPGMKYNYPSGYFYQNMWNHFSCNVSRYRSMNDINECIKGKIIYLTGDSTMIQWLTYITNNVKSLKEFILYDDKNWAMAHLFIDTEKNIKIEFRKHGNPFVIVTFYMFKEFTIPHQIDQILGNQNTVFVFTLGMHFRLFPIKHYIRRLLNIRRAIENLHLRSPETKVVVKAENTRKMNKRVEMHSDFHGYLQYSIMMDIFQGLNIILVDAWDMTIAIASEKTHPDEEVIANEVDLLLSSLC